jgi:hypothetical protein
MAKDAIKKPFTLAPIPSHMVIKHLVPTGPDSSPFPLVHAGGEQTIEAGPLAGREVRFGMALDGTTIVIWLDKRDGDDTKLGWDRFTVSMSDLAEAAMAEVAREAALLAKLRAVKSLASAAFWRLGRCHPSTIKDDAGAPIPGITDVKAVAAMRVPAYVLRVDGNPFTYILAPDDGSLISHTHERAPGLPMFRWV